MIRFFRSNCFSRIYAVALFFFLILLCFSIDVSAIPSRPSESKYIKTNSFPDKFFLNVDDGFVTLIARNNPIGSILKEISDRSGIKIETSPAVQSKKITIRCKNISLEEGIRQIAEGSGLFFKKNEDSNFSLSETPFAQKNSELPLKLRQNIGTSAALKNDSMSSVFSKVVIAPNHDLENSGLSEMVIRFKQDISEQTINEFLSLENIKVKKYISALKYHVLSLPEGMTYYDAMVLFKSKKMIYQPKPEFIVPAE